MLKKIKRAKRTKVKTKTYTSKMYSYECPHCKTNIIGGVGADVMRIRCRYCDNTVILEWDGE